MPTFTYRARNAGGELISGSLDAPTQNDAADQLRNQGIWITELRPTRDSQPGDMARTPPVGFEDMVFGEGHPKELALFYRQMAAMIRAGMTVRRSLEMASAGVSGRLKKAMPETLRRAGEGRPLWESLEHRMKLFGPVAVALIRAGETSGSLEAMLGRCADHYERVWKWKQSARKAMVYPMILLAGFIFIPSVVTLVLKGTEAWAQATLLPLARAILTLISSYAAFRILLHVVPGMRTLWDQLMSTLPVMGKNVRKSAAARFVRTFADLYDAGTGPLLALEVAADTCGNRVTAQRVMRARPDIEAGEPLSDAFGRTGALPHVALQMLATGEMSGTVGDSLNKVADFLEADVETSSESWMKALPVILWAIMAIPIIMQIFGMWSSYAHQATSLEP